MVLGVCGCMKAADPPTVSWYLDHAEERNAKVKWCADDAERQRSGDCMNAISADNQRALGTMKDQPPIDWNAKH